MSKPDSNDQDGDDGENGGSENDFNFFDERRPSTDTPVRPQGNRDTYLAKGPKRRRTTPWKVGEIFGDFELIRLIGQGSSGMVFRALSISRQWRCALKLLVPESLEDLRRNKLGFRNMICLRHPNLVVVDAIHRVGHDVALSMELVDGQTFADYVNDLRLLDPTIACQHVMDLMQDYAAGLSEMHLNGLVHRDIKPKNLMVDKDGRGQVIDYGLVGTINLDQDSTGARPYLVGTPQYMSPEAWSEQRYLPAGDVYSLGKVIFEALLLICGQQRVSNETPRDLDDRYKLPMMIQSLGPAVPEFVKDICCEMLETDPGDRPTALEVSSTRTAVRDSLVSGNRPLYGREPELNQILEWMSTILKGGSGRLHLSGPMGIGKTRLVQEVLRRVSKYRWVNVFQAQCLGRTDEPMFVLDQIVDVLASRFAKDDLGLLELPARSASILHQVFPLLQQIVTASTRYAKPERRKPERTDYLEAAIHLARRVLESGPVIVVVENSQWSDQDSLNIIDCLQAERAPGLGMITTSLETDQHHRIPADVSIRLGPLPISDSIRMISAAAERAHLTIDSASIEKLSQATEGSPFRLTELVDALGEQVLFQNHSPDTISSDLLVIDRLWQSRISSLGKEAKVALELISIAGGVISNHELALLIKRGLMESQTLDQLRRARLIQMNSTPGESLRILHDHVRARVIHSMSQDHVIKANLLWAQLLQDQEPLSVARIAGHYFEANEIESAIRFANLAAIDADGRFAKSEAARWRQRVLPYIHGPARVSQTRQTAISCDEADMPLEAANHYRELAEMLPEGNDKCLAQMRAIELWTRCGCVTEMRAGMRRIAKKLGLPKPKRRMNASLSLFVKKIQWIRQNWRKLQLLHPRPTDIPRDRPIDVCLTLCRPLSLVDNYYGQELALAAGLRIPQHGSESQRIRVAVAFSVYCSYEPGRQRIQSEKVLAQLLFDAQQTGERGLVAECLAGIATVHALSGRWSEVVDVAQQAVQHYRDCSELKSFEITHTQWTLINAFWYLGRIRSLGELSRQVFESSSARNNLIEKSIASSGFAVCGRLAEGRSFNTDPNSFDRGASHKLKSLEFLDFFESMAYLLRLIYEGRVSEASTELNRSRRFEVRSPVWQVQMARIIRKSIASHLAVYECAQCRSATQSRKSLGLTLALRREKSPAGEVIAELHDGYRHELLNEVEFARRYFLTAEKKARRLGLVPFQLAAEDALDRVNQQSCSNRLEQHLRNEGVSKPSQFARLYALVS